MKFIVELRTNVGNIDFNVNAEDLAAAADFVNKGLSNRPAVFEGQDARIEIKEGMEIYFMQITRDQTDRHFKRNPLHQELLSKSIQTGKKGFKETMKDTFLGQEITIEAQVYVNNDRYYYVPMRVNDLPAYEVIDRHNLAEVMKQRLKENGPKDFKVLIPPAIIPTWEEAVEYIKDYIKEEEKAELKQDKNAVAFWGWRELEEE